MRTSHACNFQEMKASQAYNLLENDKEMKEYKVIFANAWWLGFLQLKRSPLKKIPCLILKLPQFNLSTVAKRTGNRQKKNDKLK